MEMVQRVHEVGPETSLDVDQMALRITLDVIGLVGPLMEGHVQKHSIECLMILGVINVLHDRLPEGLLFALKGDRNLALFAAWPKPLLLPHCARPGSALTTAASARPFRPPLATCSGSCPGPSQR